MNYKMMGRFVSLILLVEAVFMLPALFISLYLKEKIAVWSFLISIFIIIFISVILEIFCHNSPHVFYAREGMVCVGISWIVMSILGCIPFYVSGEIPSFIDALFETVSGFTTTGATVVSDVEAMARGMLYWRCFTHWLGGMGVLVFILAISSGRKGRDGFTVHLLRAESPGPKVDKLVPKMKDTAEILYFMYILLTILNLIFLLIGKMPLFDAVCTAFGTAGTGGFGIKNDSMAGYSPYIQNVCTVFMLLFGVNFSCYFLLVIRQFKSAFKDEEIRLYLATVLGSAAVITWNISKMYSGIGESIRHAFFQVASIITTTGFATTDFDAWPALSKTILLCLMVIGACAGSTGGGFKCGRALLIIKNLKRNINRTIHTRKVQTVRVNNQVVEEKVLETANAYLAAYVIIIIVSFIIISVDGYSITSNLSAVLATFNNVGPGLEAVGPSCTYVQFGVVSKLVLIIDMLAGRLEIFPILILFSGSTWRKK